MASLGLAARCFDCVLSINLRTGASVPKSIAGLVARFNPTGAKLRHCARLSFTLPPPTPQACVGRMRQRDGRGVAARDISQTKRLQMVKMEAPGQAWQPPS